MAGVCREKGSRPCCWHQSEKNASLPVVHRAGGLPVSLGYSRGFSCGVAFERERADRIAATREEPVCAGWDGRFETRVDEASLVTLEEVEASLSPETAEVGTKTVSATLERSGSPCRELF